jgi:hypothetical protein
VEGESAGGGGGGGSRWRCRWRRRRRRRRRREIGLRQMRCQMCEAGCRYGVAGVRHGGDAR